MHSQPSTAARMIMVRITASIRSKQHALLLAFFWYLFADLNSRSAWRVSVTVFSTLVLISSSCPPCSRTIWATSRNSSLSSPTLCSMLRISDSRSIISDSWKSTSSCGASCIWSCCCSCCCCWGSSEYLCRPEESPVSRACLDEFADDLCFSIASLCIVWNSDPEDWNSRDNRCWVYFCDAYKLLAREIARCSSTCVQIFPCA